MWAWRSLAPTRKAIRSQRPSAPIWFSTWLALAVTSKARASAAPELPTVAEAGLLGFEVIQWYALLAPAHTPKNIIDKLNAETNRMLKLPDIREKLAAQGLESSSSTPAEVSAFMRGEVAKWTKFIRDTGLKLD